MEIPPPDLEAKFTKSATNKRKENRAQEVLSKDPRIQFIDTPTKKLLLELMGYHGNFGVQTFDAVRLPSPEAPLTLESIAAVANTVTLVEMKATTKPIRDESLSGFFFGATAREFEMATALGERYLFAFVVLNNLNVYGQPFFVLLPLSEVEARTRARRVQFQVNFRTDLQPDPAYPAFPPGTLREEGLT